MSNIEMFRYNLRSSLVSICLLFGVIDKITTQQAPDPALFGIGKALQEFIKAEVSRQIQASQDLVRRDEFTRVQQDVTKTNVDLENSIQGNKSNMNVFNLEIKRLIYACICSSGCDAG